LYTTIAQDFTPLLHSVKKLATEYGAALNARSARLNAPTDRKTLCIKLAGYRYLKLN
jgi:hypothetical protein